MQTKRTVIIGAVLLTAMLIVTAVLFYNREALSEAMAVSLQEDFKIKESLGQVFFLEETGRSETVSSSVTVTSMAMPCDGEITLTEILGEKSIIIDSMKYQSVYATQDGVIESCDNNKITLRHNDGKLSSYFGVGSLCSIGDKVEKGESIGYAKGEISYKLYENCIALDPLEFLS